MVIEVTRRGYDPITDPNTIFMHAKRKPSSAKPTTLKLSADITEEQLYQFFVMVVKAKLHLSPFFAVVPPVTFYPGTVKFDPPAPFTVEETETGFVVNVAGEWTWRGTYVIVTVFANLISWVKSEPGQRRTSPAKRLKRTTFTDIFLRGVVRAIRVEDAPAATVAADSGETVIEDEEAELEAED